MESHSLKGEVEAFLGKNSQVKFIRFQWIDYSGVFRCRFVSTEWTLQLVKKPQWTGGYRLPENSMITPISTAPEFFPLDGKHEAWGLEPDFHSLRLCGTHETHATVMCFIYKGVLNKGHPEDNTVCPRTFLSDVQDRLGRSQLNPTIGFEIEFVLLDDANEGLKPLGRLSGSSRTVGLRCGTLDLMNEMITALEKSSIQVDHFYSEDSDKIGIVLAPQQPVLAVDSLVMAREVIRTICVRYGVKASMTPKPTINGPTNGSHLHISLNTGSAWKKKDSFLAGILINMHSLCALGMANYDSYIRSVDGAAGIWIAYDTDNRSWIGYGTDNRELPVREISDAHWELRMMDGTANPYLFVGGVLLYGWDGLVKEPVLT